MKRCTTCGEPVLLGCLNCRAIKENARHTPKGCKGGKKPSYITKKIRKNKERTNAK